MVERKFPEEPTAEQCEGNARLPDWNGMPVFATWYPQMGGYVGKCVVVPSDGDPNSCFEAFVWHDGIFPFKEDEWHDGPVHIHHCMAEQFVLFGQFVMGLQGVKVERE